MSTTSTIERVIIDPVAIANELKNIKRVQDNPKKYDHDYRHALVAMLTIAMTEEIRGSAEIVGSNADWDKLESTIDEVATELQIHGDTREKALKGIEMLRPRE